jgi:hypothetical protein
LRPVSALQTWLNTLTSPTPPLPVTGVFDQRTKTAVQAFQQANQLKPADGIVGGQTWKVLGKKLGATVAPEKRIAAAIRPAIDPLYRTMQLLTRGLTGLNTRGNPGGATDRLRFDRPTFYSRYMEKFGGLDRENFAGLEQLLSFIEQDPEVTDVRWAAYMLTTIWFENRTFLPFEERHWASRNYGKPVACKVGGEAHTHVYYGRGYVQLTWQANYRKLSVALGLGPDELVHRPERVLEPEIGYRIMSVGMRRGLFRPPNSLSTWISGERCDYYNARRIINGITSENQHKVQEMVSWARQMEEVLIDSLPFVL